MIGAMQLAEPDAQALHALRLRLDQLSPRVALRDESPGLVLLADLGKGFIADGRRHGATLLEAAAGARLVAQVGVAPSATLATLAARRASPEEPLVIGPAAIPWLLDRCPVEWHIPFERHAPTLHGLGLGSLGAVAALPPDAVAGRFGTAALQAWRLLHGEELPLAPVPRPPRLRLRRVFDGPVDERNVLDATLARLAQRLAAILGQRGLQARALALHLHGDEGLAAAGRVLERPAAQAEALTPITHGLLVAAGLRGGVERLDLLVGELVPLRGEQLALFPSQSSQHEAAAAAVADLALRLGPGQLLRPALLPPGLALAEERGQFGSWSVR